MINFTSFFRYIQNNPITGATKIIELIENGSEIYVNEENKKDYVKRFC
jgi:hypothetical protein